MRLFSRLYGSMLKWSHHRHATYYLGAMSFMEASVFPIPPDVMLIPMSLAKPERAFWYATLTTMASVFGAILGYTIGLFFFKWLSPWMEYFGYTQIYQKIQLWFEHWGVWIMFCTGFLPIPFKLFTIAAGALQISLAPFLLGSIVGRGARFFLVASLMRVGGKKMHAWLERFIDYIGWLVVGLLIIVVGVYYWTTKSH